MANEVKILTTTYQKISAIKTTYGEIRTYAKVNSQDKDGNTTSYSVKATYYLSQWIETSSWKVVLDGIENSGGYTRFNAGENGLVEITRGMQHADDGTSPIKNIVTTFSAGFGGGGTTNADIQMPKIDRIPTIESANDFNDEGNGYIKFTNPAGFVVKPTLSFYYTTNTTNVLHSITRTSGVSSPYTFTLSDSERTTLRNTLKDKKEYTVRYTLKAYNSSGTYIGEVSTDKKFTFVNANPTFTTAFAETNSKVSALLGTGVSSIVKNASNIKVTVTPSAKKGASIKSVEIIHGTSDITKTASPYETTLTAISNTYKIIVTDSRGFSNPVEPITKTLIDYLPMEISAFSFKRTNPTSSDIKLNATINYKQQTFGSTANAPTLKWKKGASGTWNTIASSSYSTDTTNNKITINDLTLSGALPYTQSEKFYLSVSDKLTSDDENVTVTVGIPVFDYGESDLKVNGTLKVANSDGSVQTTISGGNISTTGTLSANGKRADILLQNRFASRPTNANIGTDASGGLCKFLSTGYMTSNKPSNDGHIIHMYWDTDAGWDSQLFVGNGSTPKMRIRGQNAGTWGSWNDVAMTSDLSSTITTLSLSSVAVTSGTSATVLTHTITTAGTYLLMGISPINRYNQNGRELHVKLQKNGTDFWDYLDVGDYGWTVAVTISAVQKFAKNDVLKVVITNPGSKQWAHGVGTLSLVKLPG